MFDGLKMIVTPDVMIPRNGSEALVTAAVDGVRRARRDQTQLAGGRGSGGGDGGGGGGGFGDNSHEVVSVLDIGTGSGCLLLAIAARLTGHNKSGSQAHANEAAAGRKRRRDQASQVQVQDQDQGQDQTQSQDQGQGQAHEQSHRQSQGSTGTEDCAVGTPTFDYPAYDVAGVGVDLSTDALAIAARNEALLALPPCGGDGGDGGDGDDGGRFAASWVEGDFSLLNQWECLQTQSFDCVVCNPPYLSDTALDPRKSPLLRHEPRLAMAGGGEGGRGMGRYFEIAEAMARSAVDAPRDDGRGHGHGRGRGHDAVSDRSDLGAADDAVRVVVDGAGQHPIGLTLPWLKPHGQLIVEVGAGMAKVVGELFESKVAALKLVGVRVDWQGNERCLVFEAREGHQQAPCE